MMASGLFPSAVPIPPGGSECSALLGSRFSFHPDGGPGWATCFGCGLGAQVPWLCPRRGCSLPGPQAWLQGGEERKMAPLAAGGLLVARYILFTWFLEAWI